MTPLHLPYIAPWNWTQFHQHFALRLLPGVEALDADRYSRTVRVNGSVGWISVRPLPGQDAIELTLSDSLHEHAPMLVSQVRKMFDLDIDPAAVARHFIDDPQLGPLVVANPWLRLPSAFDPFEQAVRAIIGQQVTVKAAVTITRRLVERLGGELPRSTTSEAAGLLTLFPSPATIAQAQLDNIGMPGKRVATLQRLAAAVAEGALELQVQDGADELIRRLCMLPGIGPWTAEYIALRGFGEADAFPAADLGLLKAPLWGSEGITARQLLARSQAWRPWRAYAAVHIWQNYGVTAGQTRPVTKAGPAASTS
ncbi:DNA-3-methyladenine glycosylase family protein [Pseudomonas sp. CBC3]|uniref:DNA-3-methyladenine glycosylase family protein n=1 Tax=Pseudomonas sp. CBC3 TaxID=3123318 RepID=UPI0030E835CA